MIVPVFTGNFCFKTQRTKAPTRRFPAIALLRSQSDYFAQVLILSAKSAKGLI